MRTKYDLLDVFRVFGAVAVLVIHTWPVNSYSKELGDIFEGMCRFAVPFFFILSGFLVQKKIMTKETEERKSFVRKYCQRVFFLYLFWWVIYIPNTLFSFSLDFVFKGMRGGELFYQIFKNYFLDFFLGSTFKGSWYVSSLFLGTIVVFLLLYQLPKSVNFVLGLSLFSFVYITSHLCKGVDVWLFSSVNESLRELGVLTNNSVLLAIPLLQLGGWIAKKEGILCNLPFPFLTLSLIPILILSMLENEHWLDAGTSYGNDLLLFSMIFAVLLFLIGINRTTQNFQCGNASKIRQFSSWMYMSQFGFILFNKFLIQIGLYNNSMLYFFSNLFFILISFYLVEWLKKLPKFRLLSYAM